MSIGLGASLPTGCARFNDVTRPQCPTERITEGCFVVLESYQLVAPEIPAGQAFVVCSNSAPGPLPGQIRTGQTVLSITLRMQALENGNQPLVIM